MSAAGLLLSLCRSKALAKQNINILTHCLNLRFCNVKFQGDENGMKIVDLCTKGPAISKISRQII